MPHRIAVPCRRRSLGGALGFGCLVLLLAALPQIVRAQGNDMFPSVGTSDKPQSKLWYNDGFWWAAMNNIQKLSIYQLSGGLWSKKLDLQNALVPGYKGGGTSDAVWDGTNLFVAAFDSVTSKVYKLSYDSVAKTYTPVLGFPISLPMRKNAKSMVIDKDSTGRLWASYQGEAQIWVTYSTTPDHKTWSAPFSIGATGKLYDASTIVAFGGNAIGVLWTDEGTYQLKFRMHRDSDPPTVWQPAETLRSGFGVVDNHLNAKADDSGRIFVAVKDYYNHFYIARRNLNGSWTIALNANGVACGTRPVIQLDPSLNKIYLFYTNWETCVSAGNHVIEERVGDMDDLLFSLPTTVIYRLNVLMNDVTGAKQTMPPGCMLIACQGGAKAFWAGWGTVSGIGGADPGGALPPPPGPPTGLVAESFTEQPPVSAMLLKMDETTGTTAHDATGLGHDTQLAGRLGSMPRWIPGVTGNGLYFDGNCIGKVNGADLAYINSSFTLEAWVKLDSKSFKGSSGLIVARGDSMKANYYLDVSALQVNFHWAVNDTVDAGISAPGPFKDLAWHHVAALYDTTLNQARLYIDGHMAVAKPKLRPGFDRGWSATIGGVEKLNGTYGSSFTGALDNVRVMSGAVYSGDFIPPLLYPAAQTRYARLRWVAPTSTAGIRGYTILRGTNGNAPLDLSSSTWGPAQWFADLSAPDGILDYTVQAIDGIGQPGATAQARLTYQGLVPQVPTAPLALASTEGTATVDGPAFFELNEGDGSTSEDGTALGHVFQLGDATLHDAAEPTWIAGVEGKALSFDSSKKMYAMILDRSDLRFGSSFTIETWVRRNKLSAQQALITKDAGQGKRNYGLLILSNGNLEFSWTKSGKTSPTKTTSTIGITDLNWHHVACTYDAIKGLSTIYLDGAAVGSSTAKGPLYVGTESILLGGRGSSGTPASDWLMGDLDMVRFTNRIMYTGPFTPPQMLRGRARRHVLNLSWSLPQTGLVASYKLYRATTSNTNRTIVATEFAPTLTSLDGEAVPGVTYVYTVTAINSKGQEGPPSSPLQVSVSPPTDVMEQPPAARRPGLSVYPNPFNPQATIAFDLERSGPVELTLFDARGRRVDTLLHGVLPAGPYRIPFVRGNGPRKLASGVYFVRLQADGRDTRLKAVLLQ